MSELKLSKKVLSELRAVKARAAIRSFNSSGRLIAAEFRRSLRSVFDAARRSCAPIEFPAVLEKIENSVRFERQRFSRYPISYDYLIGWMRFSPLQLNHEILWSASRLAKSVQELKDHVHIRGALEAAIAEGRLNTAIQLLDRHEEKFGLTFWGAQARVGALGLLGSLANAKDFAKQVRLTTGRTLISYVVSIFSQRIEPSVSLTFFETYARRRIERLPSKELALFTEFAVLGRVPSDREDQANVLAFAQNLGNVDQFETLVSVLLDRNNRKNWNSTAAPLSASAALLRETGDRRIEKALGIHAAAYEIPDCEALSALLAGKTRMAMRLLTRMGRERPSSVTLLTTAAISQSVVSITRKRKLEQKAPYYSLPLSMRERVLRTVDPGGASRVRETDAAKFCASFSCLPAFRALSSFMSAIETSRVHETLGALADMASASAEPSPYDLIAVHLYGDIKNLRRHDLPLTPAIDFVWNLCTAAPDRGSDRLAADAEWYSMAFGLVASGHDETADYFIKRALKSRFRAVSGNSAALALVAWASLGDLERACDILVEECVLFRTSPESLPIGEALSRFTWSDFEEVERMEQVAICLQLYSQIANDDRVSSMRYFALDSLLARYGVDRPSGLFVHAHNFRQEIFEHFLARSCSVEVIDMLLALGSTKEVLEERGSICSHLVANADSRHRNECQEELIWITRELAVFRGIRAIDGSRIHVDDRMIASQLKKEFAEGFDRFVRLTAEVEGEIETFEEAVRAASRQFGAEHGGLQIPESEADDLLVSMILRARECFLFDIPAGLDSYLSKRVRHGSIVGHLRAPSAQEGLATARLSDGDYELSTQWIQSGRVPLHHRAKISSALTSFSRQLDEILLRLKDSLLHVKSQSHPSGIFDIPLNGAVYRVILSAARRATSLDSFVETLLASLWGLISPSLTKATAAVEDDARRQIEAAFDSLGFRIAGMEIDPSYKAEISLAIGRARVATNVAIAQCADWFRPSESTEERFSEDQLVYAAEKMVRCVYPEFTCSLKIDCDASLSFGTPVFCVLSDALYIMLGNVARWGKCDSAAHVLLRLEAHSSPRTIGLRVENHVRGDLDLDSLRERIEQTRLGIDNRESWRHVRREGGSGLHKLASMIEQSKAASLGFGLSEDQVFFAEARFSVEFCEE